MRRRDFIALLGGVLLCGTAAPLAAQAPTYPSRPITIIVPFGPGSGTDIVSRIVAQPLGLALGQSIVIDNRVGANGGIAAAFVAKAPPDGYTLFVSTNSPHSANPFLLKNIGYDPVKDFVPITRIGSFTLMMVIDPGLPVKTLPELIAYAKANPGKLTYGSGNASGILAGETLKRFAGIDILHVPYKSVPPALNDVIGGRVSMTFTDLTPGLPHVRAGTRGRSPSPGWCAAPCCRSCRPSTNPGSPDSKSNPGRDFSPRPAPRRTSSPASMPSCAGSSTTPG
jgi:tripartite-type tricarboxylate transporter receptor subunit TctC